MILGIYNIQEPQNARIGRNLRTIWSKDSFCRPGWLYRVEKLEGHALGLTGESEFRAGSDLKCHGQEGRRRPYVSFRNHSRKPITKCDGTSVMSWCQQESVAVDFWYHPVEKAGWIASLPSASMTTSTLEPDSGTALIFFKGFCPVME